MTLSDQWLAEHNAKMAAYKAEAMPPMPDLIEFFIPYLLKLPNTIRNGRWAAPKERKVLFALLDPILSPYVGRKPHQQAEVTIVRRTCAAALPDADNNMASIKRILDFLLVKSRVHPTSFGIITDDNERCVKLHVSAEKAAHRADQGTYVRIERASW